MRGAGLDWLVAVHPVSIHWLTGSDAKSYQEFQCLLIGAASGQPLVVLTRNGEVHEFETDSLADEVDRLWRRRDRGSDRRLRRRRRAATALLGSRVGLEVPAYYLHPHHYLTAARCARPKRWWPSRPTSSPN